MGILVKFTPNAKLFLVSQEQGQSDLPYSHGLEVFVFLTREIKSKFQMEKPKTSSI
jgi:hypothetical protein